MSKPGPRPLPNSVKAARGTLRKHRMTPGSPVPKPGTPSAPDFLTADARREWKRLVPLLRARGLLELVDRAALACYCSAWGDIVDASRVIAEQGSTCSSPRGQLVSHPDLRRLEKARQTLRQFASEFGLSPSARTRVQATITREYDAAAVARRKKFALMLPRGTRP